MQSKIKNILIINAGGGIGDALQFVKLFKIINKEFSNPNIFYYGNDLNYFWFENALKSLKPNNVTTIQHYPLYFGFRFVHFFKKTVRQGEYYDLIIDNQSKIRNSLIYKKIPHKYFLTFALKGFLSNPISIFKKIPHTQTRVVSYLEQFLNKKINFESISIEIDNKYIEEAERLTNKNERYVGFSIKAGHPTRVKEIKLEEMIKTAQYFANKGFVPVFFVEEKYTQEIIEIKKNIPTSYFPEHQAKAEFKNPSLVIALGNKMEFSITIDNGVMHMLGLSHSNLFCFFQKKSEKFKPIRQGVHIYDCKQKNKKIELLSSETLIEFVNKNI